MFSVRNFPTQIKKYLGEKNVSKRDVIYEETMGWQKDDSVGKQDSGHKHLFLI